jgi:hypothetical protein
MTGNGHTGLLVPYSKQPLLQCYPCEVQEVYQWSGTAYEGASTNIRISDIQTPSSHDGNFICHYYWLIQIKSCDLTVGSTTNWSAAQMSMASLPVILLKTFLHFAYQSIDYVQVQGAQLWLSSSGHCDISHQRWSWSPFLLDCKSSVTDSVKVRAILWQSLWKYAAANYRQNPLFSLACGNSAT